MGNTAIFVDGGFYRKRAASLWDKKTPEKRASELYAYCMEHIKHAQKDSMNPVRLYRIFYYDCDPLDKFEFILLFSYLFYIKKIRVDFSTRFVFIYFSRIRT